MWYIRQRRFARYNYVARACYDWMTEGIKVCVYFSTKSFEGMKEIKSIFRETKCYK